MFISQLRQTQSREWVVFPSSVRKNKNRNFNTTAIHNQRMKEMECYISEENIKKCFNFMFLPLAKIPEIVQKKEEGSSIRNGNMLNFL